MHPVEKNPPLFTMENTKTAPGEIETAIITMFDDLENQGVLGAVERAKRAVMIKAARAVDASFNIGGVSVAISTVFKQLMEGLDSLPRPASGTDDDLDAYDATIHRITREALAS